MTTRSAARPTHHAASLYAGGRWGGGAGGRRQHRFLPSSNAAASENLRPVADRHKFGEISESSRFIVWMTSFLRVALSEIVSGDFAL